ncbi:YxlC family protein [Cohnella boryungensis]|uniref:YxlC family protein n=1 Tax=Cohnella boryungensis TaxID=768479 RepID=A0ABV8SA18_9BACL
MKPTGRKIDDKLVEELKETWNAMEATFGASPAPQEDWVSFVSERKALAKRRLWRELILFWAIAIPLLAAMLLLGSGLPAWFWIGQGLFAIAGILLFFRELRDDRDEGGAEHERSR